MPAIFLLLLATVAMDSWTPAAADYSRYLQLGRHAFQMQSWKKNTKTFINTLQGYADNLMFDVVAINQTIQTAINNANRHVSGLDQMIQELNDHLDTMQANATESAAYEAPVAFQAYVGASGQDIIELTTTSFKHTNIILNDGNAYSSSTGLFTAPVTGLYWFHATFDGGSGSRECVMKKTKQNDDTEIIGYMHYYYNQETAMTTVDLLHPGETVGIYPMSSTFSDLSLPGGHENTFAGYLVATYDDPNYVPPSIPSTTTM